MDTARKSQVSGTAAEIYESFFVPALFGAWAGPVAKAAGLKPGDQVLDVACGTGVLTREAQRRVRPEGCVVGLDCNEGMLAVARGAAPGIAWQNGTAEALPFPDESFDAVLCNFGLMFFENRSAALREMWRVLRPGGRLAVAVWGELRTTPGYAAMTALLERLFGTTVADALRAPFTLGDRGRLRRLLEDAGLSEPLIETLEGTARFPSLDAWIHTDVKGWTLADLIDDGEYERLRRAARQELQRFVGADGRVAFAAPAHIALAARGRREA